MRCTGSREGYRLCFLQYTGYWFGHDRSGRYGRRPSEERREALCRGEFIGNIVPENSVFVSQARTIAGISGSFVTWKVAVVAAEPVSLERWDRAWSDLSVELGIGFLSIGEPLEVVPVGSELTALEAPTGWFKVDAQSVVTGSLQALKDSVRPNA